MVFLFMPLGTHNSVVEFQAVRSQLITVQRETEAQREVAVCSVVLAEDRGKEDLAQCWVWNWWRHVFHLGLLAPGHQPFHEDNNSKIH